MQFQDIVARVRVRRTYAPEPGTRTGRARLGASRGAAVSDTGLHVTSFVPDSHEHFL